MKALKTLSEKKYYKYVPWEQPILTSNTSSSEMTVSATNEGQGAVWKAFDGITNLGWCTSNYVLSGTVYIAFNEPIYIKSVTLTGYRNSYGYTKTVTIYSDNDKKNLIGSLKTFFTATGTVEYLSNTWSFSKPIEINQIILDCIGGGNWVALSEINIEAYTITAGTPEDYDFSEGGRQYYKYVYSDWTQPVLDSNGVIGKSDFAVSTNMNTSAYLAMDNNTSTRCRQAGGGASSNSYYLIYSNNGLKVQKIHLDQKYYGSNDNEYCGGNLYASVDGYNFELLATFPRVNIQDIVLDSNNYYNYFKLQPTSFTSGGYWNLSEITITATQRAIIEGTAQDYDYYKDNFVYKLLEEEKRIWHPDVIEYSEVGTYSVTLPEDDYEIEVYGGGAGACLGAYEKQHNYMCGASGAGFKGVLHLPANTYTIIVGAGGTDGDYANYSASGAGGDSSFGDLIIAGGAKGNVSSYNSNTRGTVGKITVNENAQIVGTPTLQSDGNLGGYQTAGGHIYPVLAGGLSLYDGTTTGYGAGGSINNTTTDKGIQGYVKITKINGEGWYSTVSIYKAFRSYKKGEYNGN